MFRIRIISILFELENAKRFFQEDNKIYLAHPTILEKLRDQEAKRGN
jgi:hypothetical protein